MGNEYEAHAIPNGLLRLMAGRWWEVVEVGQNYNTQPDGDGWEPARYDNGIWTQWEWRRPINGGAA